MMPTTEASDWDGNRLERWLGPTTKQMQDAMRCRCICHDEKNPKRCACCFIAEVRAGGNPT
jgi:hypothetical protein